MEFELRLWTSRLLYGRGASGLPGRSEADEVAHLGTGCQTGFDMVKAEGSQPIPRRRTTLAEPTNRIDKALLSTPFHAMAGQLYGPASHMLELK